MRKLFALAVAVVALATAGVAGAVQDPGSGSIPCGPGNEGQISYGGSPYVAYICVGPGAGYSSYFWKRLG